VPRPSAFSNDLYLVNNQPLFANILSDDLRLTLATSSTLDTNVTFFFRIYLHEAGTIPPSALQGVILPLFGTLFFSDLQGYMTRNAIEEPRECRFRVLYLRHSVVPTFTASLSGTNILLSWPAVSPSFFPEMASRLDGHWSWVTNSRVLEQTNFRVTRPITGDRTFYRLRMN